MIRLHPAFHATAFALLLGSPVLAQEEVDPDRVSGGGVKLNAEEALVDVRWAFDPKKGLMVSPNPMLGEYRKELTPYFSDPSFQTMAGQLLSNAGVIGWLTLAFLGDEDFLSHCFADYHFRRLGLDRSEPGIRKRIAIPPQGQTEFARRQEEMHRLLAVRIAQRRGMKGAVLAELKGLANDQKADVLLRWAAQDAVATLTGQPVSSAELAKRYPSIDETLASVPDVFDAILSIEHRRIPFVRELPWLGRRIGMEVTKSAILQAGGSVSRAQLAGAQMLADGLSLFFFETSRHLGNLSISRLTATGHAARGRDLADAWIRVDGRFDAKRILAALAAQGFPVKDDTLVIARVKLRVSDRTIIGHTPDYPLAKKGGRAAALREQGFADHQLFLHARKLQRLSLMSGAPLNQVEGALFRGNVARDGKIRLEGKFENRAQARGVMNLIELVTKEFHDQVQHGRMAREFQTDVAAVKKMMTPNFLHEEDVITATWDAEVSYAKILKVMMGIDKAVSTQDGAR